MTNFRLKGDIVPPLWLATGDIIEVRVTSVEAQYGRGITFEGDVIAGTLPRNVCECGHVESIHYPVSRLCPERRCRCAGFRYAGRRR